MTLILGIGGLVLGYVMGSAKTDETNLAAEVQRGRLVTASLAAQGDVGETAVLERRLGSAQTALDEQADRISELDDEIDSLTVELSETEEHRQLLLTWFTPETVAGAQEAWDTEVQRLCDLVASGTSLNRTVVDYTRPMQVIGTQDDLLRAAGSCT